MATRIIKLLPRASTRLGSGFLLFLLYFSQLASTAASDKSSLAIQPRQVLDWILSHPEAIFNDKQDISRIYDEREGDNDQEGKYAARAKRPIQKDEILFQVPWDLILSAPEPKPRTSKGQEETTKETDISVEEEEDEDDDEDEEENYDDGLVDGSDDDEILVNCELVKLLQMELLNHQRAQETERSSTVLGPYLDYIIYKTKKQSNGKKVPSLFTEAGQDLFVDLLLDWAPDEERDHFRAPPIDSIFVAYECSREDSDEDDDYDYDGMQDVVEEVDNVEPSTTMWVVQRADNRVLVPLVQDIYPHGNGANANNTRIQWKEGEYYQVLASRDIIEGEVLMHSLNMCTGCLATEKGRVGRRTYENYGTAGLFRDYGFVEDYPQTWLLDECSFKIDVVDADTTKQEDTSRILVEEKDLQISWITHLPEEQEFRNEVIKYLFGLHRRLVRSRNRAVNLYYPVQGRLHGSDDESGSDDEDGEDGTEFELEDLTIPLDEWDLMLKYHDAITSAVVTAHNSVVSDQASWLETSGISTLAQKNCINPDRGCASENNNPAAISHYDDLEVEEDDMDYITPTCGEEEWMQFKQYKDIESIRTPFQDVKFVGEPKAGDVCMNLNNSLEICTSHRPHYHEMMVHYPARFVHSIKRVLIVGGGSSMLLNEVLKYPTLKEVIGLELDQTITRKSFKHFRSQPHFHDDRVEWWFGDIAKSLLHLLNGDFESFDLIVVNQAAVVRSGSVASGLNTVEILSLLLNTDGILVKNGRHMDNFGGTFDFGVQVQYHAPKICSQTATFASKSVDFFHHEQKEHGLAHHFLLSMDEMEDQFDYMHDYHKNASLQKCTWSLGDKSTDAKDTVSSYGIHRVIDIENISRSDFALKDLLHTVAQSARLHPVFAPIRFEVGEGSVSAMVLLQEGYISARLWTSDRYLAVGVNLWSAFDKLAMLESKLLQKLGTKSKSSFQVFVSGKDASVESTLLEPKQNCESPAVAKRKSNVVGGRGTLRPVIAELLNLVFSEEIIVGVVCGLESSSQPCIAKEVLEANPRISQVIVLWTCVNLQTNADESSTLSNMFDCERNMLEQLDLTMDEDGLYFDMFVVDSTAPLEMAQVFNSIWSNPKHREWYLTENNNFFLGISLSPSEENYHRQMLDRYRRYLRYDPINRAQLLIEIDGARMEVDVVSVGDVYAFYNLHVIESRIQKKIGSQGKVEVQHILGGQMEYKEDIESEEFSRDHYRDPESVKHYQTQTPLGRETIFQYEINPLPSNPMTLEKLTKHLQQTLERMGYKDATPSTHSVAENGNVVVYSSQRVSIILVWNGTSSGTSSVNVNLFSSENGQDTAHDFWDSFEATADGIPFFLTQRDDYPRGTGRVVNFPEDIIPLDGK